MMRMMTDRRMLCACASLLFFNVASLEAQQKLPEIPQPLDPARAVSQPKLESGMHTPLKEEYIWRAGSAAGPARPVYAQLRAKESGETWFRRTFQVASVPGKATLYVAGPHSEKVYINGKL